MAQSVEDKQGLSGQAPDTEEISRVVQLHIDGAAKGDVANLTEAFAEGAWMYGEAGGTRYDVPIGEMFKMPAADTGNYSARIVAIHQTADVATVELAEDGFRGTVSFVDHFSRARISGT